MSVRQGEEIAFMVSCDSDVTYRADIVELIHGDLDPAGPGFRERAVDTACSGDYAGRRQYIHVGSYARVADHHLLRDLASFTLQCFVWPTTPEKGLQGLLTKWDDTSSIGYALCVDEGGELALSLGDGARVQRVRSGHPLAPRMWCLVAASVDASKRLVRLYQEPVISSTNGRVSLAGTTEGSSAAISAELEVLPHPSERPFLIAAQSETARRGTGHFNGKIDRPRVSARPLDAADIWRIAREPADHELVGAWDFHASITPAGVEVSEIRDVSDHGLHGETVNLPTRAVTGYNWTSEVHCFTQAPDQYGAIHFHDDDLLDAGWDVDFRLKLDGSIPSGVYAARLRAGAAEDYVPFVVRPAATARRARALLVLPTASHLAYANGHNAYNASLGELILGCVPVLEPTDLFLDEHRELGLSTYDTHSDGSGVCYSSRLRPILTQRPKQGSWQSPSVWQFNADLHLVDWLKAKRIDVDLATDQDLHLEGADLLAPYSVVLTGTHPEYVSSQMLDGLHTHIEHGGRLMYLGGNGFYWITQFHPDNPNVIEVRRWGGSQSWRAEPGEHYLSFSGELGGLWRNRGRPPQKLTGVGFRSEGFDVASYYRRQPDSFDDRVAWVFEGLESDELIGNFGLVGGGAAGIELDVCSTSLGTPSHALLLASSEDHTDAYLEVVEELTYNTPGVGATENPQVRADIVYFTLPGGGAVFSVGSVTWCGSLSHNRYDNNVSRITENVLRRFTSAEPLPAVHQQPRGEDH